MKRLLRQAAGLGRDYFAPGDLNIQALDFGTSIEIANPEKQVHDDNKYNGTYIEMHGTNLIGAIDYEYKTQEEVEEDFKNPEAFQQYDLVIYITYVELRPEYRGTDAIWQGFEAMYNTIVKKWMDQYGPDKVCISSTFENDKLAQTLPAFFREKGVAFIDS